MQRSLRWRLAWSFTLLSVFAVLLQAVSLFISTEEQEEDMIDEVVNAALDNYLRQPGTPLDAAASLHMEMHRLPAGAATAAVPPEVARLPAGNHEWFRGQTEFHVGIRNLGAERIYVMYDTTEHEERLAELMWRLAGGLLVLTLMSLALGYWLAGRMLYQLQRLVRQIGEDAPGPLAEPGLDREVAQLAGAIDDYRGRNRELLAREQEFTANVSHELRTPLTRIRTGAELLADEPGLPERAKERAVRILEGVDAMENRLRGLLFLAREPRLDDTGLLDLKAAVEASAAPLRPACEAAGVTLSVEVPEGLRLRADASLLQLLLDNLLGNAVRYTQHGSITVSARPGELVVADTGAGIAAEHQPHVFERHYRASAHPDGSGLGLSIVRRVCALHGWQCRIDSVAEADSPRRGTRVTVGF
ncbi:sensor histidine kinase [Noviherbaspirillum aridicola]|uniref:histidine kinase n=1 Tax=Noviherbaspirillum aridicola TaxID=2849687 RepID=A0ABQ4Q5C5_9BURK|nr:HAMP domain-containing sensor histidine kinase [Noviherbaspirillum aridicola]GIZ52226.1 two-component sensor histidine kinase [Noviherbaspirillum aridicola]